MKIVKNARGIEGSALPPLQLMGGTGDHGEGRGQSPSDELTFWVFKPDGGQEKKSGETGLDSYGIWLKVHIIICHMSSTPSSSPPSSIRGLMGLTPQKLAVLSGWEVNQIRTLVRFAAMRIVTFMTRIPFSVGRSLRWS